MSSTKHCIIYTHTKCSISLPIQYGDTLISFIFTFMRADEKVSRLSSEGIMHHEYTLQCKGQTRIFIQKY